MIKHIIDCNANPFIPGDTKLHKHIKGGLFKWDPNQIALYLLNPQKEGKLIHGTKLDIVLKYKPVLNANVLDYLLANPQLIPDKWKGKAILFWGTIYSDSDGHLCVRYLKWRIDKWSWDFDWLNSHFNNHYLVAIFTSK